MRKMFRHIRRGAGYLPDYGSHPGTSFLIILTLIASAVGAQQYGWAGASLGAAIIICSFGPLWVHGAISRSKLQDKRLTTKTPAKSST